MPKKTLSPNPTATDPVGAIPACPASSQRGGCPQSPPAAGDRNGRRAVAVAAIDADARRQLAEIRFLLRQLIAEDQRLGVYYHKISPRLYDELRIHALRS